MITPPKIKKLFISYRSSDAAKVDKIARDLALLKHDDDTPRYLTWQDKHNLPPASPNWWDAIVDAITECDVFVFHLSRESLQSAVCRAELDYAHKRNRPIIPVVLEDEFVLNVKSGKYDLPSETWTLVPDWLRDRQFLFYVGSDFFAQFEKAIGVFEPNWPRDIPAPRPLNPDETSTHGSNHALYDAACDYAERLAFGEAENLFSTLVTRNDRDYADFAAQWIEIIRKYAELIEIASRRSARVILKARMAEYRALFPKVFMDVDIFDPKGLTAGEPAPEEVAEQERRAAEQAKADRLAAEKAEQKRLAREKAKQNRLAREKAEADRLAAEKTEQKRLAREKAKQNRLAREKAEAKRLADEKTEADRIAAEKAKQTQPTPEQSKIIASHIAELRFGNLPEKREKSKLALVKIGEPAVESLIHALSNSDFFKKMEVIEVLGKIGGARAVDALISEFKHDTTPGLSVIIQNALVKNGNLAVEPLIVVLKNGKIDLRKHAAWILSEIKDARAVKPLIWALETDEYNSLTAAEALGKMGKPAIEPLITTLKSKKPKVREGAAKALGQIGDARAVEPLIAVLKDEDLFVRTNAAEALGNIKDTRAVEPLIALLNDKNDLIREAARTALERIGTPEAKAALSRKRWPF